MATLQLYNELLYYTRKKNFPLSLSAISKMFGLKIKMFLDTAAVVIEHLGWESVFYLTGGFSLAWVVAWAFLVYDTPAQHPR
jgi:hypothetical protein